MKILMLGQNDPAGMMIAFANAINRYTEHTARSIALRTVYSVDFEYDIELPRLHDDYSEVEHLLKTADIIHFHMLMDETYQIGPLAIKDYIKGKRIVHHHHGTYDHQRFLGSADQYREKYAKNKRKVLVSTPDLLHLLPMASWQPNLVPLFSIDFLPRADHLGNQERVKLAQAPTRKWHKQTAEFQRVCARIAVRHPFVESRLITGVSYRECLKYKRGCHAIFDHMNGWFGISSLESLAHGVPTVAGLDEWNIAKIKEFTGAAALPWVIARTEEQLENQLEQLVTDPGLRISTGAKSRAFMEEHWTEQRVIEHLFAAYADC